MYAISLSNRSDQFWKLEKSGVLKGLCNCEKNISKAPPKITDSAKNSKRGPNFQLALFIAEIASANNKTSFRITPKINKSNPTFQTKEQAEISFSLMKKPIKKKLMKPSIIICRYAIITGRKPKAIRPRAGMADNACKTILIVKAINDNPHNSFIWDGKIFK